MYKINIRKLLLYLYTFILIYLPNLSYYIKINGIIIFFIFTVFYLFMYLGTKNKNFIKLLRNKYCLIFILFNIFFTAYYYIRTLIAGTSLMDIANLRIFQNIFPIIILIGVLIVFCELEDMGFSKKQKYKFLINVAVIQGFLSILMIFIPSFRNVAYNIFYQGSNEINIYISASRLYGICDGNYTYSFQILSSILALFSFSFAYFYREKKYYIYSGIIFMSTLLNGRSGIIIYGVGLLTLILYIIFKEKKLLKTLKIIVVSTLLILFIGYITYTFLPNTLSLLKHAISDIYSYVNDASQATETSSLINGLKLPNNLLDIIFGAGYRIYGGAGKSFGNWLVSDIGFINDIYMCGIFSFIFLYGSYFQLSKNIKFINTETQFEKFMLFILSISVILSNIKGEVFRSQMQIATILIIIIFLTIGGKNEIYNNCTNL